jgi:hypothetical protein
MERANNDIVARQRRHAAETAREVESEQTPPEVLQQRELQRQQTLIFRFKGIFQHPSQVAPLICRSSN